MLRSKACHFLQSIILTATGQRSSSTEACVHTLTILRLLPTNVEGAASEQYIGRTVSRLRASTAFLLHLSLILQEHPTILRSVERSSRQDDELHVRCTDRHAALELSAVPTKEEQVRSQSAVLVVCAAQHGEVLLHQHDRGGAYAEQFQHEKGGQE